MKKQTYMSNKGKATEADASYFRNLGWTRWKDSLVLLAGLSTIQVCWWNFSWGWNYASCFSLSQAVGMVLFVFMWWWIASLERKIWHEFSLNSEIVLPFVGYYAAKTVCASSSSVMFLKECLIHSWGAVKRSPLNSKWKISDLHSGT